MARVLRLTGIPPPESVDTILDYRTVFESQPRSVGPYQLGRVLGQGRLGSTFEAWHLAQHRGAVLKVFAVDAQGAQRLLCERWLLKRLEAVARVTHRAIVPLREVGLADDGLFVASLPVPGRTLEAALSSGWRPPPALALDIVKTLAAALACAHAVGVVHGNLHAGQVMIDSITQPKLTDLGLVPAANGLRTALADSHRLGDRACQAPEQRVLGDFGPAADIYALGVLLIRLLVDERCFVDAAKARLHTAESGGLWTPIEQLCPALPAALAAWITRAVDPDAEQRPRATDELPDGLASGPTPASTGSGLSGSGTTQPNKARRSAPRRLLAGTLATMALVGATLQVRTAMAPARPADANLAAQGPAPAAFEMAIAAQPPAAGKPNRPASTAAPAPTLRLDR